LGSETRGDRGSVEAGMLSSLAKVRVVRGPRITRARYPRAADKEIFVQPGRIARGWLNLELSKPPTWPDRAIREKVIRPRISFVESPLLQRRNVQI
jgi:hypothetical protein